MKMKQERVTAYKAVRDTYQNLFNLLTDSSVTVGLTDDEREKVRNSYKELSLLFVMMSKEYDKHCVAVTKEAV